jgi:hypothetical protein
MDLVMLEIDAKSRREAVKSPLDDGRGCIDVLEMPIAQCQSLGLIVGIRRLRR